MIVRLSSELPVSASIAFAQAQRPALLRYVAAPLLRFCPQVPFPARWQPGTYKMAMYLFGWFPLGQQRIGIEYPNDGQASGYSLRDNGGGQLVSVWDHCIDIEPLTSTQCRYTDTVTIRAGLLTPVAWLFACMFYAWRQRRWRLLARHHFTALNGY